MFIWLFRPRYDSTDRRDSLKSLSKRGRKSQNQRSSQMQLEETSKRLKALWNWALMEHVLLPLRYLYIWLFLQMDFNWGFIVGLAKWNHDVESQRSVSWWWVRILPQIHHRNRKPSSKGSRLVLGRKVGLQMEGRPHATLVVDLHPGNFFFCHCSLLMLSEHSCGWERNGMRKKTVAFTNLRHSRPSRRHPDGADLLMLWSSVNVQIWNDTQIGRNAVQFTAQSSRFTSNKNNQPASTDVPIDSCLNPHAMFLADEKKQNEKHRLIRDQDLRWICMQSHFYDLS